MTIPTESLNSIVEIILLITIFAFAIFSIMLFFILKITYQILIGKKLWKILSTSNNLDLESGQT